ncbi:hypothetical protein GF389_06395, partial [Candidatus Dojkabacteria bacterium]|nr:hypothetical protein [Candidatus Dojkabacteria bacterium]
MDLLHKNIDKLSFQDIVDFCKSKEPEGIQLDYKLEVSRSLKKHFATFSNKRGGIIIIGVDEDRKTGLPIKYDGVTANEKHEEKLHQYAAELDPLPHYKVTRTDEHEGKVFILIRIFEGPTPPYYVQNDPNVYVRTGSVTKKYDDRYDIASAEEQKLLFQKINESQNARTVNLEFASRIYKGYWERKIKNVKEGNPGDKDILEG